MVNCNRCGQEIHFDDSLVSAKGKKIPLQGVTGYDKHDCPANPYKKGFNAPASGNLEAEKDEQTLLQFVNRLDKLDNRVNGLETLVKDLSDAVSKMSFQKGTEVE